MTNTHLDLICNFHHSMLKTLCITMCVCVCSIVTI